MKLIRIEKALMNNPVDAFVHGHHEVRARRRLRSAPVAESARR